MPHDTRLAPARRAAGALALALFVLLAAYPTERAVALVRGWRALQRSLPAAVAALRAADGSGAEALAAAQRDLERAEAPLVAWRGLIAPLAGRLSAQHTWPWLAHWATVADQGSSAALSLCGVGRSVLAEAQRAAEMDVPGDNAISLMETPLAAALRALSAEGGRVLAGRAALAEAVHAWQAVASERSLASTKGQVLQAAPLALDCALVVADWLGDGEPHQALLLVQNADELRATGGYISVVVALRAQGGAIETPRYISSDELESYAAVHPAAPDALRRTMGAGVLLLRDGNWSPNYPTTAEVVAALYALETGEDADLVVAIDTAVVDAMLTVFGPLALPRYNVTVSADDFYQTAALFWAQPLDAPALGESDAAFQEWLAHRKDFGAALLEAVQARVATLSADDTNRLLAALAHTAQTRDLLAWAPGRPEVQAHLRRAGLDGALRAPAGDYLMVVDSNVGWNKADRHIARNIDYAVRLGPEGPRALLTLTYEHTAGASPDACVQRARYMESYEALTEQCYWAYTRVLVPAGSMLLGAEGLNRGVDVTVEEGKASFGFSFVVPPGEKRAITLEYQLPADVLTGPAYPLLVQRQPGSGTSTVRVTVDGVAAEGLLETDLEWLLPLDAAR